MGIADTGDGENEDSIPSAAYDPEVFDGLVMRYETPNADNRWDSPLILQLADDKRPESEGPDSVCEQVSSQPGLFFKMLPHFEVYSQRDSIKNGCLVL